MAVTRSGWLTRPVASGLTWNHLTVANDNRPSAAMGTSGSGQCGLPSASCCTNSTQLTSMKICPASANSQARVTTP